MNTPSTPGRGAAKTRLHASLTRYDVAKGCRSGGITSTESVKGPDAGYRGITDGIHSCGSNPR